MKRISIFLLILFSSVSLFAKTKVIFDADIDTDCDDGGAFAVLHALADNGEVEILATIVSTRYPYSAPCVEAINRYYGRPDIPIGAPKSTWTDTGSRGSKYARQISEEYETTLNSNDDAEDAVKVYRRILAAQESNSVVILSVGYLTNIRDLLESGPDDISPLSGVELVRQKVSRWVCNGAEYPNNYNPGVWGNFTPDPTSAHIAVRDWPGILWFCGEGRDLYTGGLLYQTPATNPVRRIYELYGVNTRPSWDPISTLFAVRTNEIFWTYRSGDYYIFENGTFEWRNTPHAGHHIAEYNTSLATQLRDTLDQLMIQPPSLTGQGIEKLSIAANNRVLIKESGEPFFPIADTVWKLPWKLNRQDVLDYLQIRKEQKFNAVSMVAFPMNIYSERVLTNVYGEMPFELNGEVFDPLSPIVDTNKYDYWDHLDFIISSAQEKGLYVILLPAWGSRIAGDWGDGHPTDDIILNMSNASNYAYWISHRFKNHTNIIWMIGGDRSAVYDSYDYRPEFREMAAGVLAGNDNQPILMSYHPRKWKPNSSEWFHNDNWLSFNSIQDDPSDQINAVRNDYSLSPTKPTWLFEGGYEERSTSSGIYGEWQVRFQAYQTIFAGGFGFTYGHMSVWDLGSNWKSKMQAPGANDMQHLSTLMSSLTNDQFFSLIPDQSLIDGDTGSMSGNGGIFSTCIVAIRTTSKDLAMVYSANGQNIRVKMNQLTNLPMRAIWFNPRTGLVTLDSTNIYSGSGAPIIEFDPPGDAGNGNDYVLVLDLGTGMEPSPDPGPDPDPLPSFFADTFNNVSIGIINNEIDAAGRQFGTLSPLDYTGDGNSTSTVYLGTGKAELTEGFLIRDHNSCFISPNHNFNDIGENFTVEVDARIIRSGSWAGFSFGIGAEDQHEVIDTLGGPLNGHISGLSWWLGKQNDSAAPQLLIAGENFISPSHLFKNSEIDKILDEDVHLTAIVHTKSFGGADKVITALFVNGKPMVANAAGVGAMFVINKSFTNNYIVIGEEAGYHDTKVTIDNFRVTKTDPRVAESTWTD
ncbi:DUF4038 domain-containing protein, partial [bacterium]|nr:DUF4038 domain-containing protein [bacterium]